MRITIETTESERPRTVSVEQPYDDVTPEHAALLFEDVYKAYSVERVDWTANDSMSGAR